MKRFYSKFRIFLMMLALGLSSVTFFQALYSKWSAVKVNLPQVQSDAPILIIPYIPPIYKKFTEKDFVQNRNLPLYDLGNEFSNCFNHGFKISEFRQCGKQQVEARSFISKHWKEKKLGYIIYEWQGYDSAGFTHVFIEPDTNGEWSIISRGTGGYRNQNLEDTKGYSIKYKRAKSDDDYPFEIGTNFLAIFDENGSVIERF